MDFVYKICTVKEWQAAQAEGVYEGSADDRRDGFIHFSAPDQLAGTLAKHFAGQSGLLLIEVSTHALGDALKWEPSRARALFPHLYGALPISAVTRVWPLPLSMESEHVLPKEVRLG